MEVGLGPGHIMSSMPSAILIQKAVWPQSTWAKNWGLFNLFGEGELGPHLTQSRLGQGLPAYQVAS